MTGVRVSAESAGAAALRLASRGSALALAQAELAVAALRQPEHPLPTVVVVRTRGDLDQRATEALDGEGWFTSELESALHDGRADVAVHSAKDLPTVTGAGLTIAAHLERADPRDALVLRRGETLACLDELPEGGLVGTSSPRRAALLRAERPDLRVTGVRGNVDTRLRRLDEGAYDALLLACAGLDRLGLGDRATLRLDPRRHVPAPAQGAIALQCRAVTVPEISATDHRSTTTAVVSERRLLAALGGGCRLPLGAWARLDEGVLVLSAALGDEHGSVRRVELGGDAGCPIELAEAVAARLRS